MRLLIDETLATAPFAYPLAAGWALPAEGVIAELRTDLRSNDLAIDDVALLPAAEVAVCQETHQVVPDVAVVADGVGAVAMRVPVRPDEVERTPVHLHGTSGTAELLARATLRPFYGIEPTAWVTSDHEPAAADAQVVVVEGTEALRSPEAGFAEDLCRAWFILTGTPAVSHVLLAPRGAERSALQPVLATLSTLRQAAIERRREWRESVAEQHELPRDRLNAFFAAQRLNLTPDDRRALLLLLQRGGRGSSYQPPAALHFLEPTATTD